MPGLFDRHMFEFTAKGRYYKVYVDGVYISQHTTEREALERASSEKFFNPDANVIYVHEYEVDVGLSNAGYVIAIGLGQQVDVPPSILSTPAPIFTEGVASNYNMAEHWTDDGISTITSSLSNPLPNGLNYDGNTHILSYDGVGAPSVSQHALTATDAVGFDTSSIFSITINSVITSIYVSAAGSPSGTGEITDPLQTVADINALSLGPGNTVFFRRGDTFVEDLINSDSGVPGSPVTFSAYGTGLPPILRTADISGAWHVLEDIDFDCAQVVGRRAVRFQNADNSIYRRSEAQNGILDGLDIRDTNGIHLEDLHIHHMLRDSYTGVGATNPDAHGIVCRNVQNLTAAGTIEIHHVSGDSFQADPDREPGAKSDNLDFSGSINHWWTGPLATAFNAGWPAGTVPGENAIDTKVESGQRMSLTIHNLTANGWAGGIPNMAALNIKEGCDFILDGFTGFDNNWDFRLRKTTGTNAGNPDITIMNAVTYDSVSNSLRIEDGLDNLKMYNNTFGDHTSFLDLQSIGTGADLQNNVFFGTKPAIFSNSNNIEAVSGDFVDEAGNDYRHLDTAATIEEQGVTIVSVTQDRLGVARVAPYSCGAYEVGVATSAHAYFDSLVSAPLHGTAHAAIGLRDYNNEIEPWIYAQSNPANRDNPPFYDATEDACSWIVPAGATGVGLPNGLRLGSENSGSFMTGLSTGIVMVHWEIKFANIDWKSKWGTVLDTWKLFQIRDDDGESTGLETRMRWSQSGAYPEIAEVDFRTYSNFQGATSRDWQAPSDGVTVWNVHRDVWTRFFYVFDMGTNTAYMWVGDENRAPTKIFEQGVALCGTGPRKAWSIQAITSQEGTTGPEVGQYWVRNLAWVRDIGSVANADALVAAGSQV